MVGAGLGRTGTHSVKLALERLLAGRCYHMSELIERPQDTSTWHAAVRGRSVDWDGLLSGYVAAVDWPACAFWRDLLSANPKAVVLLTTRETPEAWWESMERTIVSTLSRPVPADDADWVARRAMVLEMIDRRFDPAWASRDESIEAYERHNAAVRDAVAAERLIEWRTGDGWEPICAGLELRVPEEPFPHVNTAPEFRASQGLEDEG